MWWFNKARTVDIWDEKVETPLGDIEAAHRVRDICRAASDSAERAGRIAVGPGQRLRKSERARNEQARVRYERAARAAMEIAIKMSDDLMRDAAVRDIVDLCMKAGNIKTARTLLRAIQAVSIRTEVVKDHPALNEE